MLVSLPGYSTPVVTAHYEGKPLRFLFDTGASVTLLRPPVYEALGRPGESAGVAGNLTGVNGMSVAVPRVLLPYLEIGSCKLANVEVWVTAANIGRQGNGGMSGILGVDVMKRMGRITYEPVTGSIETAECG